MAVAEPEASPDSAGAEPTASEVEAQTASHSERLTLPGTSGPRRPARYGLSIQFEAREGDPELGKLVESTVWVNEAHPAFRRAAASRSEGYHIALSVALALAPLAAEAAEEHGFVTTFLERWGEALGDAGGRRRLR